ncbi:MAG: NAD(P)H-dependent oxidoreductase [Lactobacillus sp.]|jgi:NAD(P)H dehydrogenase (quinone)|nr:NAD(P)H-dependent oxidoreductase [Lactobacillus sp.]
MKTLIVYAYPNHTGFNHAILTTVKQQLQPDADVQVLDLYAEHFNPVLYFDKAHRRRDLQNDPETAAYRQLITWADQLIFVFPIWWSGMPAILKGFIDRVFALGFAYKYEGRRMLGLLGGKRAWIITTCNSPVIFKPFLGDYGHILQRQILRLCGVKPVKLNTLYNAEKCSLDTRKKFLKRIGQQAAQL